MAKRSPLGYAALVDEQDEDPHIGHGPHLLQEPWTGSGVAKECVGLLDRLPRATPSNQQRVRGHTLRVRSRRQARFGLHDDPKALPAPHGIGLLPLNRTVGVINRNGVTVDDLGQMCMNGLPEQRGCVFKTRLLRESLDEVVQQHPT